MEAFSKFFGFNEDPFKRTPDVEFYYPTKMHQDALETLNYLMESEEPFAVLTGEPGTGKTMTIRKFISELSADTVTAYILFPNLSPSELFMAILEDFKIKSEPNITKNAMFSIFRDFLLQIKAQGKKVVIIIDEAQNLPSETLEELRILSNLETEKEKLLKIILAGQPELSQKLDSDSLRQLKQRITLYAYLSNMEEGEIKNYINSHLVKAGRSSIKVHGKVVRKIAKITQGNPRLVNTLMERAMIAAFLDNSHTVTDDHLASAMASVNTIMSTIRRRRSMKYIKALSAAAVVCLCVAGSFAAFSYFSSQDNRSNQTVAQLGQDYSIGGSGAEDSAANEASQQNAVADEEAVLPEQELNGASAVTEGNSGQSAAAAGESVALAQTHTIDKGNGLMTDEAVSSSSGSGVSDIARQDRQGAEAVESSPTAQAGDVANAGGPQVDVPPAPVETVAQSAATVPMAAPKQPSVSESVEASKPSETSVANVGGASAWDIGTATPTESVAAVSRIVIKANSLNVREHPNIDSHRISSVYNGEEFDILGETQFWIRIQLKDGQFGWVFKQHTERLP